MKKSLACVDLGVPTCTFEVRSENKEELKDAMFTHAQKYHPDKVGKLSDKQKADLSVQMDKVMK